MRNEGNIKRPGSIQGVIDFPSAIVGATPHQQAELKRDENGADPHSFPSMFFVLMRQKLKIKLHAHLEFNLYVSYLSQIYLFYYYSHRNIKGDIITRTGEILRHKENYTSTPR